MDLLFLFILFYIGWVIAIIILALIMEPIRYWLYEKSPVWLQDIFDYIEDIPRYVWLIIIFICTLIFAGALESSKAGMDALLDIFEHIKK